jgi:hypothetical protein
MEAMMDQDNSPAVSSLPGHIGEQRPFWIEPPRTTADRIVWETFEQMVACGAEIVKRNGIWVRKLWRHEADRKTLGADGVLRVPRVAYYRRVFLTREAAMNGQGDFYMVDHRGRGRRRVGRGLTGRAGGVLARPGAAGPLDGADARADRDTHPGGDPAQARPAE